MRIETLRCVFLFIALVGGSLLAPSALARDFHNCDANEQVALNQSMDYVLRSVSLVLADEEKYYEQLRALFDRPGARKGNDRPRFHQVLACIKEKLENDRFDLRCSEGLSSGSGAQVRNADILLSHLFGSGTIEIHSGAVRYSDSHPSEGSLTAVMAHEISHLCDTQDLFAAHSMATADVSQWHNAADAYALLLANPKWNRRHYF